MNELEDKIKTIEEDVKQLSKEISGCVNSCGLASYKIEMRERCERLSDKIENNKDLNVQQKMTSENLIRNIEDKIMDKIKVIRGSFNKFISIMVLIGLGLGGIIGTIQIDKVSQMEFNNHLISYNDDRRESVDTFNSFMRKYDVNREKRDNKIDDLLLKQLDFNDRILRNNALLTQQLEVINTIIDIEILDKK